MITFRIQSCSEGALHCCQNGFPLSSRRFSLFSSMYGIIWFLTAYILVCTSLKTCRLSSPHIWWLTIAILCTMYLKFILLSLIVSVFALVFVCRFRSSRAVDLFFRSQYGTYCSVALRSPIQKTQIIRQDIRKLPKNLVDRIPLVVYVPTFPDASHAEDLYIMLASVYSYPPKFPTRRLPGARQT